VFVDAGRTLRQGQHIGAFEPNPGTLPDLLKVTGKRRLVVLKKPGIFKIPDFPLWQKDLGVIRECPLDKSGCGFLRPDDDEVRLHILPIST
jgi:hypothetical protein